MKERVLWIDHAKAFAIFFVCLGHIHYQSPEVRFIIYSFHMPLFFLLSGMFSNSEFKIINKIKGLLVPYIFFNIFTHLLRFSIGKGPQLDVWIVHLMCFDKKAGLWFLPCLFSANILMAIIIILHKKSNYIGWFAVLLVSVIGVLYNILFRKPLPFSFDISLIILPFMFIGYIIKNTDILNKRIMLPGSLLLYIISMVGLILLPNHLSYAHIDLFRRVIGNPFMFYITAASGCIMVISFFHNYGFKYNKYKLLSYVGQSTLIIYCLHKILIFLLNFVFSKLLVDNILVCLLLSIIEVLIVILLLIPVSKFINKYTPFMVGRF